jgi:hypothetical protein
MTNVGNWASWYQDLKDPWPYGETTSYEIGAAWLADCALIEDWGCGAGWLRKLVPPDRYRGIDGTASPVCDEALNLITYCSSVPGIFMRHVLEHNYDWRRILDNAVASFKERMVLILFTPERATTEEIAWTPGLGVPDIAFRFADITDRFPADVTYAVQRIYSATQYGCETIFFLERSGRGSEAAERGECPRPAGRP